MALTVRWTKIAVSDLNQAFDFVSTDSPQNAKSIVKTLIESIEQLKLYPDSGRVGRVKNTKELVIASTSFVIVYRIKDNFLDILAVLHTARKW